MKKLLVAVLVVLTTALFAGTVSVIGPWSGSEMDAFIPVLEAFKAETGIDYTYQTYRAEDLANVLPAQFAARKAPADVIFMWSSFITNNTKNIAELTDVIDRDAYIPGALDNVTTADGKVYGIAYTAKVKPGFWYRKSFFEAHDLEVPSSWEEFVALLEKIDSLPGVKNAIASGNGVGWPLSDVTEHFLITFGGPELQKDLIEGNTSWRSHAVRNAMGKLVYLIERGFFSVPTEWTTILEQWWKGDYGLYFMGQWITGMVEDADDLAVFSLPGNRGMVFSIDYAFVPEFATNKAEALELVKFLAGEKGQSIQVAQGGHIATVEVAMDNYPAVDMEIAKLTEGVQTLNDLDDSIGGLWQTAFWDQLKLIWVRPERLNDALMDLDEKMPN
ncbi:ABC transporter substrate-binding protein [Mesotoga sp. Brook.08.YT.4.2.5.1]|uniref:ABC transporter substrate-binding protein n=1 Tax=unclassified Mesotoga TaxID=1184398 RepID=UPI000C1779BF|nr:MULTISPECIES: extracellular solute-binding protein [unclassified Mesotoga]PNQ05752.1 ABC transporter substrate-binding protein [Mesotoga sp. SC_NapDC3]PXF35025.1 ABC transporter substrate-binding protein [Mesotoga sp. SC_NapDC]RAM58748.1 ABC transporter substrate-binding protein [Mesotoga sp. SC_4PWL113PWK15]PNE18088.1 ABC transporter substrate-binding protein [Mesotoga sp. Brook.08.YT.4.2.5.1]PNS41410.1 ABC transporter substrate-binding protein [Mesotoga sp. B105.6.4]